MVAIRSSGFVISGIPAINQRGFTHLAFEVDDVELVLDKLLQAGGSQIGEVVRIEYEGGR